MNDFFDTNMTFEDFKGLLNQEELDETPVPLDVFVTDKYFLGLRPLSPVQTMIVERMTQIFFPDTLKKIHGEEVAKQIWDETVNEVVCEIGKGGGKDFSIRIAFARIIYLLHCLKDPNGYFGIGNGEYIDLLNIALNSEQAQRVFFDPLKNILTQSPYFQRAGFNAMSKKIEFMEKPIRCFSGHSEGEGWEGFNLIAVVLDEISAFKVQEEVAGRTAGEAAKHSAKAIYDMARLSIVSRFPAVGKVALLSFPRYEGDFIEQRYAAVIEEKKTVKRKYDLGDGHEIEWLEDDIISYREPKVWAVKCPTFISNPTKTPDDFKSDFIRDPVGAKARILCMPPKTSEAYFRDPDAVMTCFHTHDDDCQLIDCPRSPLDDTGRMISDFRDPEGPPRFIHIDLGLVRDRSALCMVHCKGFVSSLEDGQKMPVIQMDLIKYWQAPPAGEIDFNDMRKLVFALAERFPIAMITMDRWQSVDTRNIFLNKGLFTEFMVVKKEHYDTLSTSIYDKRLQAYHHPILVDQELLKLQLVRGTKVDHPNVGFKDGSDCLAGAVYTCTNNTVVEEELEIDILGLGYETKPKTTRSELESPIKREVPAELREFIDGFKMI